MSFRIWLLIFYYILCSLTAAEKDTDFSRIRNLPKIAKEVKIKAQRFVSGFPKFIFDAKFLFR